LKTIALLLINLSMRFIFAFLQHIRNLDQQILKSSCSVDLFELHAIIIAQAYKYFTASLKLLKFRY